MFPFNQAALPQLTPRRAFVAVDFQNEFTAKDGALPVSEPLDYVQRTVDLAAAFREKGDDVVWIKSRFDGSRDVDHERIIVTDRPPAPPPTRTPAPEALRVRRPAPAAVKGLLDDDASPDPEAFLSDDDPVCLKPASPSAADWTTQVKGTMQGSDMTFTKTHYSAFRESKLLHILRAKMVMEVFICGSLTNVGVYATAMDAAGHGLTITIVEDCCGYRSETRHRKAIERLIEFTGCEVASAEEVLESISPQQAKPKSSHKPPEEPPEDPSSDRGPVPRNTPDIVRPMSGLRLNSGSPAPSSVKSLSVTSARQDESRTNAEATTQAVLTSASQTPPTHESKKEMPSIEKSKAANEAEERVQRQKIPSSTEPLRTSMNSHESDPDSDDEGELFRSRLCERDTDIIENLLPADLEKGVFDKLRDEVEWKRMSHQGGEVPRLVAVQGEVAGDGSIPVYRHPSDESPPLLPFSPTVLAIKAATEKHLGHTVNHVLIQFYRDGKDYISEHSDKTLDIARDSYIANVSLGAERTMVLRTKRDAKGPSVAGDATTGGSQRQTQRASLPHNSLFRMGLRTNMKWLHSIRQDKRADREKTANELAFSAARISLTFRKIGTFLDKDEKMIWGQGATGKTREDARAVINGTGPEAVEMLKAFGAENHSSTIDWDALYGKGFDVLHMSSSPRFFASSDAVVNMRIALMLAELGIGYAKGSMGPAVSDDDGESGTGSLLIKFVDNDAAKSTVQGDIAIMMYLERVYGDKVEDEPRGLAKVYSRFQQALELHSYARPLLMTSVDEKPDPKGFRRKLEVWDGHASEDGSEFLAGSRPTLSDFVVFPVLHVAAEKYGEELFQGMDSIKQYYKSFKTRESAHKILGN